MTEKLLSGLSESDQTELASGEDYIICNNLRGSYDVWINCNSDMQVSIVKEDLVRLVPNLFPGQCVSDILETLDRGEYLYTNRQMTKKLRPAQLVSDRKFIPTLDDVLSFQGSQKSHIDTPYGLGLSIWG